MSSKKQPPTISVSWRLPRKFLVALGKLKAAGCSDDDSQTQVSALRQSIIDEWEITFPDKQFPEDTDEI